MKRVFIFFLFSGLMLSFPAFLKQLTGGFRVENIRIEHPFRPEWETEIDLASAKILSQQFNYLGKGTQSYVFESQDGKYVIKLFRSRSDFEKLSNAAKIAYDLLPLETGLVALHLNQTSIGLPTLKCKDALGRRYRLELDRYRFALQRKGAAIRSVLEASRQNPAQMKKKLDDFIQLLKVRTAKGIVNFDSNLSRNFGFLEDRAIEMDFGSFAYLPNIDRKEEIRRYVRKLQAWLKKNAPEWVSYLDNCLDEA